MQVSSLRNVRGNGYLPSFKQEIGEGIDKRTLQGSQVVSLRTEYADETGVRKEEAKIFHPRRGHCHDFLWKELGSDTISGGDGKFYKMKLSPTKREKTLPVGGGQLTGKRPGPQKNSFQADRERQFFPFPIGLALNTTLNKARVRTFLPKKDAVL